MRKDIVSSAIGILVLTLLFGIVYPLAVTGVSQVAFPGNANGQKVYVNGKLVGSKLIGQQFALQVVKNGKPQVDKNGNPVTTPDPRYFQTRPSATAPPTPVQDGSRWTGFYAGGHGGSGWGQENSVSPLGPRP